MVEIRSQNTDLQIITNIAGYKMQKIQAGIITIIMGLLAQKDSGIQMMM